VSESLTIPVDEHLELRLITEADDQAVYDLVMRNYDYMKPWVGWVNDRYTLGKQHEWTRENLVETKKGDAWILGVYQDGKLCGVVDIRGLVREDKEPEVGYYIDQAYSGQGITTKATGAMIDYFQKLKPVDMMVLHTHPGNKASRRVAEKLSFIYEGLVEVDGKQEARYKKVFANEQTAAS
jgi:ribosomal-protein-serine acetyltransferase